MKQSDLETACANDGKLAVMARGVALGTQFAYYDFVLKARPRQRREFFLDEWLPKEVQKRATIAMSLCDGMAYVDVVKEKAARELLEWRRSSGPPSRDA